MTVVFLDTKESHQSARFNPHVHGVQLQDHRAKVFGEESGAFVGQAAVSGIRRKINFRNRQSRELVLIVVLLEVQKAKELISVLAKRGGQKRVIRFRRHVEVRIILLGKILQNEKDETPGSRASHFEERCVVFLRIRHQAAPPVWG